jgi:hypothetical protein
VVGLAVKGLMKPIIRSPLKLHCMLIIGCNAAIDSGTIILNGK